MGVAGVGARHLHQLRGRRSRRSSASAAASVCTSSNAARDADVGAASAASRCCSCPISTWAATPRHKMGVPLDADGACGIRTRPFGGLDAATDRRARGCILWKGHCSVHTRFTAAQIEDAARSSIPASASSCIPKCRGTSCRRPTTAARTEYIIKHGARTSPAGSVWAVGTEVHLVNRLAHAGCSRSGPCCRSIQFGCLCSTMFRVSPNHLLWILEGAASQGDVHNRIVVS